MSEMVEQFNKAIAEFGMKMVKQEIPAAARAAGISNTNKAKPFDLKFGTQKDRSSGTIVRLGFKMNIHAIYREKGVGRGRGIGSGNEITPPFFNPAMDRNIEQLADDLIIITGDALLDVAAGKIR
jgi:hypothetical protein